jgi:peptidoglycan/xylan/chitin deacetylase (PgdA/CDA1 family)
VRRAFGPLVLCYHRISSVPPHRLAVAEETLEEHLRALLSRGYRAASADETLTGRAGLFHVTFDDAYRSIAAAVPLLERLRVPATVFACSSYADDGRPLRIPELADDVDATPGEFATLTWDELGELAERGVEIGSHTVSHPHLTQLSDAELDRELRDARERIAERLGRPCRLLAYPYGDEDVRVRAAARRAGYEAAFALPGRRRPFDQFGVPRVDLYWKDTGLRARAKLSPLFWLAGRARKRAGAIAPARSFEKAGGS